MTEDTPDPIGQHYDTPPERAEVRPAEHYAEHDRPAEAVLPSSVMQLIAAARQDKHATGRITAAEHAELLAWESRIRASDPSPAWAEIADEIAAIIHRRKAQPQACARCAELEAAIRELLSDRPYVAGNVTLKEHADITKRAYAALEAKS